MGNHSKASGNPEPVSGFHISVQPLVEGDEPADAAKFHIPAAPPEQMAGEAGDLPKTYGGSTIFLVAQDPHRLFTYWDLDITRHPGGPAVIRCLAGEPPEIEVEFEVPFEARNWYIPVNRAGTPYRVEIGFYRGGKWNLLGASETVMTPRDSLSEDDSFEFATLPLDVAFSALLASLPPQVRHHPELMRHLAGLQKKQGVPPGVFVGASRNEEAMRLLQSLLGDKLLLQLLSGAMDSAALSSAIHARLKEVLASEESSALLARFREVAAESSLFSGLVAFSSGELALSSEILSSESLSSAALELAQELSSAGLSLNVPASEFLSSEMLAAAGISGSEVLSSELLARLLSSAEFSSQILARLMSSAEFSSEILARLTSSAEFSSELLARLTPSAAFSSEVLASWTEALMSWAQAARSAAASEWLASWQLVPTGVSSGELSSESRLALAAAASWFSLFASSWEKGTESSWAAGALSSAMSSWTAESLTSWSQAALSSWLSAAMSSWTAESLSSWTKELLSSWSAAETGSWFTAPERSFFMHVNAEVIFYGGTHPDAKVTIAGKPVALTRDGTFHYHFVFPDGTFEIPIVATSPDGVETRKAVLRFRRETERVGQVDATGQPPLSEPMGRVQA